MNSWKISLVYTATKEPSFLSWLGFPRELESLQIFFFRDKVRIPGLGILVNDELFLGKWKMEMDRSITLEYLVPLIDDRNLPRHIQ